MGFRVLLIVAFVGCASVVQAAQVDFELVTEPGYPVGAERDWLQMMEAFSDVSLRIRTGRGGEEPAVDERGEGRFHVIGVLTSRNQLVVPGGKFNVQDRKRLQAWLDRLDSDGPDGLTASRGAFGLTEEQLVAANDALAKPIDFATKDLPLNVFIQGVKKNALIDVTVTGKARGAITSDALVMDELKGLSCGTALAAALRPHGLAASLTRDKGETALSIIVGVDAKETWPIGWELKQPPREAMPKLFSSLQVQINDTAVGEAIAAIQGRVGSPFLLDHNAMAKHGIELDAKKVNFPSKRAYYKRILDTILSQAKLKCQMRIDEAGTPFLWITTMKT